MSLCLANLSSLMRQAAPEVNYRDIQETFLPSHGIYRHTTQRCSALLRHYSYILMRSGAGVVNLWGGYIHIRYLICWPISNSVSETGNSVSITVYSTEFFYQRALTSSCGGCGSGGRAGGTGGSFPTFSCPRVMSTCPWTRH